MTASIKYQKIGSSQTNPASKTILPNKRSQSDTAYRKLRGLGLQLLVGCLQLCLSPHSQRLCHLCPQLQLPQALGMLSLHGTRAWTIALMLQPSWVPASA